MGGRAYRLKKPLKKGPSEFENSLETQQTQKNRLEARVGIEPTMQLLQSRALPLGDPALRESPANKGNE